MKTKNYLNKVLFASILLMASFTFAQNSVSGSVVDAENEQPLPSASVVLVGSNTGTATDFDGNFTLTTSRDFPFSIKISSVGFTSQTIEVTSADQSIKVALAFGSYLDEIVVSASRKAEKVLDAPASVSVISSRNIENSAQVTDPIRHLVNVPGVNIQQHTANSINIEMRAGSGVFGTSTFPILDYRYLITPSAGTFLSYQAGLSNIDIDNIEVVRGAASALYGPGVTSGVVHFRTKSPIDHPGTTIEAFGGEMNTLGASLRHAYSNESKTFGYKINARYSSGDDFVYDDESVLTANPSFNMFNEIRNPIITNGAVDPALSYSQGNVVYDENDMDPDGDGNVLRPDFENYSVNAHLEFRPNDKTTAFLSGGVSNGRGAFFNGQGIGYAQGNDYWGQARIQTGGLFAQVSYNYNDGGSDEDPTFLYATGLTQTAKRSSLEGQLQYAFDAPGFLNSEFVFGMDYRFSELDGEGTVYGRNEDIDDNTIVGFYGQGTSKLGEKLDLTYALRMDSFNYEGLEDKTAFAPRVALVYKASETSSFRLSYNQSSFVPSGLQMFIDFPVSAIAPGIVDVWLAGQTQPQGFAPEGQQVIDVSIPGVPDLPVGTPGLPLAVAYGAVAAPTIEGYYQGLQAQLGAEAAGGLIPLLNGFFNSYAPSQTAFTGSLAPYNIFSGQPMDTWTATPAAEIGTLTSWEVGYKGLVGKKLGLAVDIYTYERKGFDLNTAIGPTFALVGANVAGDLGNTVAGDLEAYLNQVLPAALTPSVTAAVEDQYTQLGIPEAVWSTGAPADALFPGSDPIASVADVVAVQLPGAVAATVDPLVAGANAAFQQGGAGFDAQASALYQVFGAVESDRVPEDDVTHISTGYRRYGDATRSHVGADVSLEYYANNDLTIWGNASWLSQNEWIPGEDNDDDLPFEAYLNAPTFKFRLGMNYFPAQGFRGSLSFQHDDAFFTSQGFFSGITQEKNLFDMSLGYKFNESISFDVTGTNIFDREYQTYPNFPMIGRRIIGKITYKF